MQIEKVTFLSEGEECSALYYLPSNDAFDKPYPAVVMAHGFSLVKEAYLPNFASKFAEAGLAVLLFDYRNFGESGGSPRQHMDPLEQIKDYRNAITWLTSQPQIDENKVGIWGTSYSGGHVLHVGALDKRVKAIVSQVPTIRGWIGTEKKLGKENMAAFIHQLIDYRMKRYHGADVQYIKVVTNEEDFAAQTHPEAYEWFIQMANDVGARWENRITLESMEHYLEYYPAANIDLIAPTPIMFIVAMDDGITPAEPAIQLYENIKQPKKLVKLPGGHFDVYNGDTFSKSVQASTEWLIEHLGKEH